MNEDERKALFDQLPKDERDELRRVVNDAYRRAVHSKGNQEAHGDHFSTRSVDQTWYEMTMHQVRVLGKIVVALEGDPYSLSTDVRAASWNKDARPDQRRPLGAKP